ncbi:ABC transporter permease [Thalassoroseus pseudoceratinae]|uniref:ABC transporter permease n=1 Tax=Thalassoroseus pseudoceratinae TaxID=2713176 RepID=UPI0014206B20|nr:ABC transporter permease [Thalassoroseus pseudoceratinae]
MFFRLLPWEYAIRNLFRRPLRTSLTFAGLTTVILLVFVVVGFIRGLERSLAVSGDPQTAVVFSLGMGRNLEYSSIPMRTSDLIPASVAGLREQAGQKYVSPELYLGTRVTTGRFDSMGLVRGVTRPALLVRSRVEIEDGEWPKSGEVMIGRLVAAKLEAGDDALSIGNTLTIEGRDWRISGVFSAGGSAFESEIWCRLDELQQAMKRQDLSIVAVTLAADGDFTDLDLFCKQRLDLELQTMKETEYYGSLQEDYGPIRWLAWLVVLLVSGAGVFAGLNTMYGSVVGRIPELATLQTIGFARRAIVVSLIQEGLLMAAGASLMAAIFALVFINGAAVRFTMGAFALRIDSTAVLIGCSVGLLLGLFGSIPPTIRALRMPVVDGLKAV